MTALGAAWQGGQTHAVRDPNYTPSWSETMATMEPIDDLRASGVYGGSEGEDSKWNQMQKWREKDSYKQQIMPSTWQGSRMPTRKMVPGPQTTLNSKSFT